MPEGDGRAALGVWAGLAALAVLCSVQCAGVGLWVEG